MPITWKSVLFAGQSYYHAWYLSRELRKLGWKADVLNWVEDEALEKFYHGEDIKFSYKSHESMEAQVRFYEYALQTYNIFHFSNTRCMTFGPVIKEWVEQKHPGYTEITLLKKLGKKIVYSNNGCHDGVKLSTFRALGTREMPTCDICFWNKHAENCSDELSIAWGEFRNSMADYQVNNGGNRHDYNLDPHVHDVPEFYCLDPDYWRPDLSVPEQYRLNYPADTVKIYHAVGNYDLRTDDSGTNLKCTHIYSPLIKFFKAIGYPVEMIFARDIPSRDVRFLLVQADIVVDMLTFGNFGANIREALMLGKPTVCYLRPEWLESMRREIPQYVDELPVISATPMTIHDVLKDLIEHPEKRLEIGRRSREFAIKWHSAAAGAKRFDRIYTELLSVPQTGDRPPEVPTNLNSVCAPRERLKTLYLEINDLDRDRWKPLCYVVDWRDAFLSEPRLDVELCNITDDAHYSRCLNNIADYDLIVVSHAATGDDMTRLLETRNGFARRKGKLAVFIGNEYDLMSDKITFISETGAEYICTQLPLDTARWLYAGCVAGTILPLPHALNPERFHPLSDSRRDIDIGFIGDIYFPWVGDIERTNLIQFFSDKGKLFNLNCFIATQRLDGDNWNLFLNACKGIIGAESGTYYLNGKGELLRQAKEYMHSYPETSFHQLYNLFFRDVENPVSGKAISSRHFEPIGTKTCQLLLEGHYNGILKPDEHYIPIRRDLSNVVEAIGKLRDTGYRQMIADQSYDFIMDTHTYRHRLSQFIKWTT